MPKHSVVQYMSILKKVIDEEVNAYVWRNLAKGKTHHMCLCCGFMFVYKSRYHQFCSRKCYSKFHRIPGFVRRIINQKD